MRHYFAKLTRPMIMRQGSMRDYYNSSQHVYQKSLTEMCHFQPVYEDIPAIPQAMFEQLDELCLTAAARSFLQSQPDLDRLDRSGWQNEQDVKNVDIRVDRFQGAPVRMDTRR